jgi:hypothetical protein
MKFDIGGFFEKYSQEIKVPSNCDKNNGQFIGVLISP